MAEVYPQIQCDKCSGRGEYYRWLSGPLEPCPRCKGLGYWERKTEPRPHPAKFSPVILNAMSKLLYGAFPGSRWQPRILDPFAGTGLISELRGDFKTVGIELEREWACQSPGIAVGDSAYPPIRPGSIDALVTSVTYGNRMADSHDAKDESKRLTYTHQLGHPLTPGNTGLLHFRNEQYKWRHVNIFEQLVPCFARDALCLLNVSNFMKDGSEVDVVSWWADIGLPAGSWTVRSMVPIKTRRMGFGANRDKRVECEYIIVADNNKGVLDDHLGDLATKGIDPTWDSTCPTVLPMVP